MIRCPGVGLGEQTVTGTLWFYTLPMALQCQGAAQTEDQLLRLERAQKAAIREQVILYQQAQTQIDKETAQIFEMYAMLLQDPDLMAMAKARIREGCLAEMAVVQTAEHYAQIFSKSESEYMAQRADDIRDAGQLLLRELSGCAIPVLPQPVILACEELSPSTLMRLERSKLLGVVTRSGALTGHAAILARGLGLPMLMRCEALTPDWNGTSVILDEKENCLVVSPTSQQIEQARVRQRAQEKCWRAQQEQAGKPAQTLDGTQIALYANLNHPVELGAVLSAGAEGIGMFRSEFLFLNRLSPPKEEEQVNRYHQVLAALSPARVIVRTFDLGADKYADYLHLPREENPALGCRGVRLYRRRPDLFRTQLRALLRAARFGDLAVMFPMVTCVEELRWCKQCLQTCREELEAEGIETGILTVGVMIETPAAALLADELAQECDFFSIGTNDLTQYTCALDRQGSIETGGECEYVTAVLKLIEMTVAAAHRHGCWVGICGELAGVRALTSTFLRMGVDEFSLAPGALPGMRQHICQLDLSKEEP